MANQVNFSLSPKPIRANETEITMLSVADEAPLAHSSSQQLASSGLATESKSSARDASNKHINLVSDTEDSSSNLINFAHARNRFDEYETSFSKDECVGLLSLNSSLTNNTNTASTIEHNQTSSIDTTTDNTTLTSTSHLLSLKSSGDEAPSKKASPLGGAATIFDDQLLERELAASTHQKNAASEQQQSKHHSSATNGANGGGGGGGYDKPGRIDSLLFSSRVDLSKLISGLLECFSDIRIFIFFMCLIVMLTNALTVGYRNSVITTVEKRYEFSSVLSGILSGFLEFGSLITTLFVSYFCTKSHIPRCIAISSLCCAMGAFLYALPHFLSGSYTVNNRVMNKTTNDLVCKNTAYAMLKLYNQTSLTASQAAMLADKSLLNDPKALSAAVVSFLNPFDMNSNCIIKPNNFGFFVLLIMANILIGSSSAPLYTLGTTYIDNYVSKESSSVYLAFIYSQLAFGPVVGYLVGAAFLQVYVDALSYNTKDLNITPGDSNWVGAWYGGFIIFAILIFVTSFPFFAFPRIIKSRRDKNQELQMDDPSILNETAIEAEKKAETTLEIEPTPSAGETSFGNLRSLPKAIKNILANRIFMIVTLAFCFEITIISGFMTFLPKYIEHQFSVNNSVANIYTGGVAIPGACVGIVMGGYLVKRFKIDPTGASKMAIVCNALCIIGIIILLFLGCPNIKMAGTTMPYETNERFIMGLKKETINTFNLSSTCNQNCQCSTAFIEPVCGKNGLTYFSPCYAGCKKIMEYNYANSNTSNLAILDFMKAKKLLPEDPPKHFYTDCSCILNDLLSDKDNASSSEQLSDLNATPHAHSGPCPAQCKTMTAFLIMLFLITLLTALNQMPMIMVTLRSVSEIERPFALGLQLVIMRLLAYIPSPLIFGRAIDLTCLVWRSDDCNQTGSCLLYDRDKFRNVYGSIAAVYKAISLLLFILLFIKSKKYCYKEKPIEISTVVRASINSLHTAHKNNNNEEAAAAAE